MTKNSLRFFLSPVFSKCSQSLPFSLSSAAFCWLAFLPSPVLAASTTTLPIETYTLEDLAPAPKTAPAALPPSEAEETVADTEEDALPPPPPPPQPRKRTKPPATLSLKRRAGTAATAPARSAGRLSGRDALKLQKIKEEVASTAPPEGDFIVSGLDPDHFELGGVRLGMNFRQARIAMAANLGIDISQVKISGTPPEPQTCTSDTQLSAEGENGAINVQFACNAKLPLHNELSVDHISYEPASGEIRTILARAIKKYGKPVNLNEVSPQAEYVTYDWCAAPEKDIASDTGSGSRLYCPAGDKSRLRLQGRDNSLELNLTGLVGAARHYDQTDGAAPASLDDDDSAGSDF